MHSLPLLPWQTASYHMRWNGGLLAGWFPWTLRGRAAVACDLCLAGWLFGTFTFICICGWPEAVTLGCCISSCLCSSGCRRNLRCNIQPHRSGAGSSGAWSPAPSVTPLRPECVTGAALTETGTCGQQLAELGWLHMELVRGKAKNQTCQCANGKYAAEENVSDWHWKLDSATGYLITANSCRIIQHPWGQWSPHFLRLHTPISKVF